MRVQLGNPSPVSCVTVNGQHTHQPVNDDGAPAVTYEIIPDGQDENGVDLYGVVPDADVKMLALHLAQNPNIHHLAGHEAFLSIASPSGGLWQHHGAEKPSWVWSDNDHLAATISEYFNCPVFTEADLRAVEDSHWTKAGAPGVVPGAAWNPQMNITNNGRDAWAYMLGGGIVGQTGVATAVTATTLTTTFTTSSVSQFNGQRLYTTGTSVQVFGIIQSCTSGANAVFTVDRWYTPSTPGGTAGATPSATGTWVITDGYPPAWFIGLSASTTGLSTPSTNATLPGEITTASGGLVRKISPWAHTASANTYTLTPVYTANGSDSLPVTIGSIGVFTGMVPAANVEGMLFNTLLGTTATLSLSGDVLTLTETVTGT